MSGAFGGVTALLRIARVHVHRAKLARRQSYTSTCCSSEPRSTDTYFAVVVRSCSLVFFLGFSVSFSVLVFFLPSLLPLSAIPSLLLYSLFVYFFVLLLLLIRGSHIFCAAPRNGISDSGANQLASALAILNSSLTAIDLRYAIFLS